MKQELLTMKWILELSKEQNRTPKDIIQDYNKEVLRC